VRVSIQHNYFKYQKVLAGTHFEGLSFLLSKAQKFFGLKPKSFHLAGEEYFFDALAKLAGQAALAATVIPKNNQSHWGYHTVTLAVGRKDNQLVLVLPQPMGRLCVVNTDGSTENFSKAHVAKNFLALAAIYPQNADARKYVPKWSQIWLCTAASLVTIASLLLISAPDLLVSQSNVAVLAVALSTLVLFWVIMRLNRTANEGAWPSLDLALTHAELARAIATPLEEWRRGGLLVGRAIAKNNLALKRWVTSQSELFFGLSAVIFLGLALWYFDKEWLLFLFGYSAMVFLATRIIIKAQSFYNAEKSRLGEELTQIYTGLIHVFDEMSTLNVTENFLRRVRQAQNESFRVHRQASAHAWLYEVVHYLPIVAMLGMWSLIVFAGFTVDFGQLLFLMASVLFLHFWLTEASKKWSVFLTPWPSRPIVAGRRYAEERFIQRRPAGQIELVGVSFKYESTSALVINDAHMKVSAASFVGIFGKSGSGKTTLLRLMMNQLVPTHGQVIYDGLDGQSLNPAELNRHFGVVMPTSLTIAGTILQNIVVGRSVCSKDLSWVLHSHEIFEELFKTPMGLNTYVMWHGKNLSPFQTTLIFLARALIHRPAILFLDEVALGASLEEEVTLLKYLRTLPITRIVASHRPEHRHLFDESWTTENGFLAKN
jgi:ABC-type bacteriocin/lantibiotic exporter with double-glycine peptidase domain